MVLSMTCAENKKTLLQQSEMSGLREWIVDIGSPTAQFEIFLAADYCNCFLNISVIMSTGRWERWEILHLQYVVQREDDTSDTCEAVVTLKYSFVAPVSDDGWVETIYNLLSDLENVQLGYTRLYQSLLGRVGK